MMDAFAGMGTRWWVFNGGEPPLIKPLGRYIQRGKQLGMNPSMVTNGTFIERRIDELESLDLVICSIHGDREEHDRIVQHPGAYDTAIAAQKLFAGARCRRLPHGRSTSETSPSWSECSSSVSSSGPAWPSAGRRDPAGVSQHQERAGAPSGSHRRSSRLAPRTEDRRPTSELLSGLPTSRRILLARSTLRREVLGRQAVL